MDLQTDGTYRLKYEDGDEEHSVQRHLIEPVEVYAPKILLSSCPQIDDACVLAHYTCGVCDVCDV